jgi:hypothetical protein
MTNRKFGWHSGAVHCKSILIGGGTLVSGEVHVSDFAASGALLSGKGLVAQNIVLTTKGTAGSWACGLYVKIVEGTTKNVNGYLNAAEFELSVAGTYNPSDMCVLALNSTLTNTAMSNCSHPAYIYLRDYGTAGGAALGATSMNNLFWFGDQTIGADADGASLLAANTIAANTHTIRFLIGNTPYYIMCSNVTHN